MKISKLAMSAFALGFCLPLAAHAACNNAPSASELTGVTTFRQIGDNWCWAAAGQMTMKAIKPFANVKQCIQANDLHNQSNCCANGSGDPPDNCDQPGAPDYDRYGYDADYRNHMPLTWSELVEQIYCRKKPFAFSWERYGYGEHMMVVVGYSVDSLGVKHVKLINPYKNAEGGTKIINYSRYKGGPLTGYEHVSDYINIRQSGS